MSTADDAPTTVLVVQNESHAWRDRRRHRRGAKTSKTSKQRRLRRVHLQEPWWFTEMRAQGLVPLDVSTEKLAGGGIAYPVILPSKQAVFILPKAVNAHRLRRADLQEPLVIYREARARPVPQ